VLTPNSSEALPDGAATTPSAMAGAPDTGAGSASASASASEEEGMPAGVAGGSAEAPGQPSAPQRVPTGDGARGVTDTSIKIGLVSVDSRALNAIGGAVAGNPDGSVTDSDVNKAYAAVIDWINAHGGIAGRTIEPVFHLSNLNNAATASGRQQEAQAACATWTEDNEVFAFVGMQDELILECAKRTRTPVFSGWITNAYVSERGFQEMAEYWYAPDNFTADRRDAAVARFLAAHGFFGEGAKVGIMVEDRPMSIESADRSLKPALAAAGVEPVVEIHYPDAIESPWANYILQLQSAGVTHVVFGASAGGVFPGLFMMRAAEDQRYRPAWGMGSDNTPDGLITLGNVPRAQLEKLLAMGWVPEADVSDATAAGENGRQCREALQAVGEPEDAELCLDILFFLRDAFAQAAEVSTAGLAAATARLGNGYSAPSTHGGLSSFGARNHDGVSIVRPVRFDPASPAHLSYAGPPEPVPA
jgi:hypothetical protein